MTTETTKACFCCGEDFQPSPVALHRPNGFNADRCLECTADGLAHGGDFEDFADAMRLVFDYTGYERTAERVATVEGVFAGYGLKAPSPAAKEVIDAIAEQCRLGSIDTDTELCEAIKERSERLSRSEQLEVSDQHDAFFRIIVGDAP